MSLKVREKLAKAIQALKRQQHRRLHPVGLSRRPKARFLAKAIRRAKQSPLGQLRKRTASELKAQRAKAQQAVRYYSRQQVPVLNQRASVECSQAGERDFHKN